ncbi:hypothetical protein BSAF29S_00479 [Bacillus safensis subsp. safensis]
MKKQLTAAILLSMLLGGCGFQSGMNRQVDEDFQYAGCFPASFSLNRYSFHSYSA